MSAVFKLNSFPSVLHPLLDPTIVPELGPGMPNQSLQAQIQELTLDQIIPDMQYPAAGKACLSAIWLLHDFLDESHAISQDLQTPEGSYWHAIMHRREPDAWNSKYWFRKVGNHPVVQSLQGQCHTLGYRYTTPEAFVDFCEANRGKGNPLETLARKVQRLEWNLLFAYCDSLARFGRVG